jgi:uncharacterized protein (TIGR02284 family)
MTTQNCIDACNKLLRGELSAVETYAQAEEKFAAQPQFQTLEQIRSFHSKNADILRHHIEQMGGSPSRDSSVWGDFAKSVEGTARMFGRNAALQALKMGEEHGVNEYEDALADPEMMAEIKETVRRILPRLHENVATLDRLQSA